MTRTGESCSVRRPYPVLCDLSRDSDSSSFFDDSDSSPVFFSLTRTRIRTQKSWLVTRAGAARIQAVAAVPCCAFFYSINKWRREKYFVCFHVLEDKEISNMWTTVTGLVLAFFLTRTRGLGLWGDDSDSDLEGDDSDSDSEVMTRTQIWQFGLGHSTGLITICKLNFLALRKGSESTWLVTMMSSGS